MKNIKNLNFNQYMNDMESFVDLYLSQIDADDTEIIDIYKFNTLLSEFQNVMYDIYNTTFSRKLIIGVTPKSTEGEPLQLFTLNSISTLLSAVTLLNSGKQKIELIIDGDESPIIYYQKDLPILIDILDFLYDKSVEVEFIIISAYEACYKLNNKNDNKGLTKQDIRKIIIDSAKKAKKSAEQCGDSNTLMHDAIMYKNKKYFSDALVDNGGYLN